MTKLQQLKQKIQELRPEKFERHCGCHDRLCEECVRGITSIDENLPITLEDVLDVLPGNRNWFIDNNGIFYKSHLPKNTYDCLGIKWLLGNPLESQSEETIEFLYKLICE